jgi:hypothetical protein
MCELIPGNAPKAVSGGQSAFPTPHSGELLENGRQFNLCVFGAVGLETLKDLFAIHPSDCIVSTRMKVLVEISGPSFAPDGGFFDGFSGPQLNYRKCHRIGQVLILVSSHKSQ